MVMPRLKKSRLDPAEIKKVQANIKPSIHVKGHWEADPDRFSSLVTWQLVFFSLQNFNPVSADIIPQRQPYSEFFPTSTLPLIKIRSPYLPSSMLVRRLILYMDHGILLERLSTSYGLSGMAYTWLESYITGRTQIIHVGNRHSPPSKVLYGVRSSGISVRTGFVRPLHFGCSQTCRGTWPWCSPLCRWHPAVWPLFTCQFFWVGVSSSSSYWLNSRVDVLEPAQSQHRQDTIHLAWYKAQSCKERYRSAFQRLLPSQTELTSVRNLGFIIDQELNMKDHITK